MFEKEYTTVFEGNIEVTFNDPEFMYDDEYLQEPKFRKYGVESDGGMEDYGNWLLEH